VKAKPSLVGADGAVEFHTEPFVDPNGTGVIHPWHSKENATFRFRDAFQNTLLLIAGKTRNRLQRFRTSLPPGVPVHWVLIHNGIQTDWM
jgi:hypothetical protein